MSVEATIWAWKQSIPTTQKIVLLSMADRAGEDFRCWPSIKRLCHDTSLSERTVQQAITNLTSQGIIKRDLRQGRVTMYYLVGVHARECATAVPGTAPITASTPAADAPPQQMHTRSKCTPAANAPHPRSRCTPPPQQMHPNLKLNLKRISKSESAHSRDAPAPIPEPEKIPCGQYGNVRLTEAEHQRLVLDFGAAEAEAAINFLDMHLGASKKRDPYKSHNLALRKWVFTALVEDRRKRGIMQPQRARPDAAPSFDELTAEFRGAHSNAKNQGAQP